MDSVIVLDSGVWTVRKILSREGAVRYGRREWCTAREASHYEHHYSSNFGDLYIFETAEKKRPQYQMFLSKTGYLEFRNGGNQHAVFQEVFAECGALLDWYNHYIQPNVQTAGHILRHPFVSPGVFFREVDMSRVVSNVDASISAIVGQPINQDTIRRAREALEQAIIHVHREEELPVAPALGTICHRADRNELMIYTETGWVPVSSPSNFSVGVDANVSENTLNVTISSTIGTSRPGLFNTNI